MYTYPIIVVGCQKKTIDKSVFKSAKMNRSEIVFLGVPAQDIKKEFRLLRDTSFKLVNTLCNC